MRETEERERERGERERDRGEREKERNVKRSHCASLAYYLLMFLAFTKA